MTDNRTISLYDKQADGYADRFTSDHPYPLLESFIDSLPKGGDVLDLGCGPGVFAARMAERGLQVDALDASTGMADVARARYGLEVRIGTFDDVAGEAIYDGIWAHYSLLHAPRDAMPRHLAALRTALRPEGRLVLVLKIGEGDHRDRMDRFYTYYSETELEQLLSDAGFSIFERGFGEEVGFEGQPQPFIALQATLAGTGG